MGWCRCSASYTKIQRLFLWLAGGWNIHFLPMCSGCVGYNRDVAGVTGWMLLPWTVVTMLKPGHGGDVWHMLPLTSVSGSHVLEPHLYNPFLFPDFLPNADQLKLPWPWIFLVVGFQHCQLLFTDVCAHSELLGLAVIFMVCVWGTIAAIWGPTMTGIWDGTAWRVSGTVT